jgi:hypothetical protein
MRRHIRLLSLLWFFIGYWINQGWIFILALFCFVHKSRQLNYTSKKVYS